MFIKNINQFRECRCNIYISFIFYTFNSLTQNLFCNKSSFLSIFIIRFKIHEQRNKWRLTICSHQCIDLILDSLNTILNLFTRTFPCDFTSLFHIWLHTVNLNLFFNNIVKNLFVRLTYKWCQNAINTINTLTAILPRCNLSNNLCCHCTCNLERFRCINLLTIDNCTICKHIFQID